jgi:hypothetical protein
MKARATFVNERSCSALLFAATVAFSFASLLAFPRLGATLDARAAGTTQAVRESLQARLVSHRGTTVLNEQGRGSGTFNCPVVIDLKITYTQATVTFTCSASKGAISGRGVTEYYAGGHFAHFTGQVSVTSGTGSYSRASGSVHINGTLTRGSYALSATISGNIRV